MNYWIFTHFSTSIYVSLFRDGPSSISRRARSPAAANVDRCLNPGQSRYPAGASCVKCWPHGANLTKRAEWFLSRDSPQAFVLQAERPLSDAVIATLPRRTRDRALTGGEAAPLDQPWRASHRSGHDDAKALLQAHRHVISRGSRRTGDAELFAGGQDAQQIFLHVWMAGLAPQSHRHRHVPGACPDGADAPHLTQNVAYVLHPFCFFDDAHQ